MMVRRPHRRPEPRRSKQSGRLKTPMYTAMNAGRYQRQEIIKQINAAQHTNLICYVSSLETEIDRNDVIGFVEMLHNIPENSPIDLLLNTGGGDVDACEKLVKLMLAKAGTQPFRVIVPDLAKSAGTLMALRRQQDHHEQHL